MNKHVVLVGGGHAHIEVIRCFGEAPIPGCEMIVVDPNPRPIYSGMVPGLVAGMYERSEVEIDLAGVCRRAGAEYVHGSATRIDAPERRVLMGEQVLAYDVASLDVGSTVLGADRPGVREHALPARPMTDLLAGLDALLERARSRAGEQSRYCVVGSGAGGIELAFCLDARLRSEGISGYCVDVVTKEKTVLASAAARLRRRVERAMKRRGIGLHAGVRVRGLRADAVELEEGDDLSCQAAIWATGPAAHPFAADSDLPVDQGGFVRVQSTLEVGGWGDLFAVGDCASLPGMKKAGVYAVRTGPLLDRNLRARIEGKPLAAYLPQHDFLSLLNLGDGTAVGTKWRMSAQGRTMMWLKDRIDRAFMEKYQ